MMKQRCKTLPARVLAVVSAGQCGGESVPFFPGGERK